MARVLIAKAPDAAKPVLEVALSERNLLLLVSKLYRPGSQQTLRCNDVPPEYGHARIRAEHDDYHYAFPTREGSPAGPMDPVAEIVCTVVKTALELLDPTDLEAHR